MGEEREVLGWIEAVLEEPLPKGDLAKVESGVNKFVGKLKFS